MDAHIRTGLSKECFNRLFVWSQALQKALANLKVDQYLWKNPLEWNTWCIYNHDGKPIRVLVEATASSALVESAVILMRQVFSTGGDGPDFASNRHPDIEQIRREMDAYVRTQLGWPDSEYDEFYRLVRDRRNQLLAHYDGQAADYHEPIPEVASMKIVGANLSCEERDRLEQVISAMLTFVQSRIFPE
jgi:hypothetical protein